MKEITIRVAVPQGINTDSWLNEERFADFRAAYDYACTQSQAIPGLAALSAEHIYHLHEALKRGGP